jgi:hypothetical protein
MLQWINPFLCIHNPAMDDGSLPHHLVLLTCKRIAYCHTLDATICWGLSDGVVWSINGLLRIDSS